MKFASLIHRASRVDPSLQQAPDVVRMATRNGSAALGTRPASSPSGKKADVILVDLQNQMFTPLHPESRRRTSTRTWSSRRTAAR